MNYRTGRPGRVIVARFEDRDDVLGGLVDIARRENVRCGVAYLVGGMRAGRFVVGPLDETMPPKPDWRELTESHEIIGIGTIFWDGETPKVHLHAGFGKRDEVRLGCIREGSETFLVLEAVIIEIEGMDGAVRAIDPATGLSLLKL